MIGRLQGWDRTLLFSSYVLVFAAACVLWQYAGDHSQTFRLLLSTPTRSIAYARTHGDNLLEDVWTTGVESALGLLLAIAFSMTLMIFCLYFPRLLSWLFPVMVTSQVIPLVTLAPLFILFFGLGIPAKIAMASLLCFFPTFVGFARGVSSIDVGTQELVRLYAATKTFRVFRVVLPMSIPYLMTGIRVSATLSVIGAIVGEFNGADRGLGRNLFLAAKRLEPELTICSLAFSAGLGGLLYVSVLAAERWVAPWHVANRSEVRL